MSRFLLATFGSLGDLHPYIAIGRALRERGHVAVIASAVEYQASIEAEGLQFAPLRPSLATFGDTAAMVRQLFSSRRGPEYLVRRVVMPHLRETYDDLLRAAEGADLLVSHPLTMTLPLVAEKLRLPWVSSVLAPLSFMSNDDPPMLDGARWLRSLRRLGPWPYATVIKLVRAITRVWEAPLRELRRELGLPPSTKLALFEGQFSPLCNLALFDAVLATPQRDWPPNTHRCGVALFDGAAADPALLADLERYLSEGEPPIVFALGSSAVWIAGDYWQQAIEACQALNKRAILLTGSELSLHLPPGIRAYPYLPYSAVFPRAAAVVHQAGIGTLSQALRSGAPQLITPVAFDQPDNAWRAARLGLARVLPFRKVTQGRLQEELGALIEDESYASAARNVANELRGTNGAAVASERLIVCLKG